MLSFSHRSRSERAETGSRPRGSAEGHGTVPFLLAPRRRVAPRHGFAPRKANSCWWRTKPDTWGCGARPGQDAITSIALFPSDLPSVSTAGRCAIPFGAARACVCWAIGTYAFERYRGQRKKWARKEHPRLVVQPGVDGEAVSRIAEGVFLARSHQYPGQTIWPSGIEQARGACRVRRRITVIGRCATSSNIR